MLGIFKDLPIQIPHDMEAESSFKFDRRAGVHRPSRAMILFGKSEALAAGMDICAALETDRPRKLL